MDQRSWKSNELKLDEGGWEPADYNVNIDGIEYGWWRRTLREHRHGLTVISHYKAPSGQGWEIVGKASSLDSSFPHFLHPACPSWQTSLSFLQRNIETALDSPFVQSLAARAERAGVSLV